MKIGTWLAVATLVLVAGCGSDGSSEATHLPRAHNSTTSVDRATWSRADAACRPLLHWFRVHPHALTGFNPVTPTSASLRRFAVTAHTIPLYQPHALTRVVHQVGEPARDPEAWARLTDDFRRFDVLTQREVRDAVRGDVRAWGLDYTRKRALLGKLGADLVGAGAPDRNQCQVLLG